MKFLPLIWAGLWRKPLRTTLTALSVVAAFIVLGLLQSVSAWVDSFTAIQRDDRLYVGPKYGQWMPFAYLQQIESIPGILAIAYDIPPGGYYREPKNGFGMWWTNADTIFMVRPELHVSPEYLDALKRTRDGIVVSAALAQRFDWKVGDRVTIGSQGNLRTDGTELWPFEIVGIYTQTPSRPGCCVIENYAYFSDSSAANKGQVGAFMIRVRDAHQSAQIAAAIDKLFENSPAETHTELEHDNNFMRGSPVDLIMHATMIAGFAILLVVTTVTTLQSLRERTREFGVLKAVGFGNGHIQMLVVTESVVLTLASALIGIGGATLYMRFFAPQPFGGVIRIAAVFWGLGTALAVAAVSSFLPVWRASRLDAAKILADV